MYATFRKYRTSQAERLSRAVNEGFARNGAPAGLVAYYAIDTGNDEWASFSIFETEEQARQSTADAAEWSRENVAPLLESAPEITAGRLVVRQVPTAPEA
jgi:L-aminopeptidase/D-esterase-like protein